MAAWDIDPAGVQRVLAATEGLATEFDGQVTALNAGMEGAMTQSGSDLVAGALADFGASQSRNIEFVFTRTGAAINGAAQATNAYVAGDEQMAVNAQAAAASAPDPSATMPGPR